MSDNYRRAEDAIIDEITADINAVKEHSELSNVRNMWGEYATALALHRLANAWERRVEIAEATAKQKGVIE
ncbi:hypothetical protein [Dermabacter hominis]|uniref:hypothetical protein n=1 Tax=Dermabacter hominis TaxID=36740 RepID=UPI002A39D10C|nr:hypothetical protein [Dermabacter hominis]